MGILTFQEDINIYLHLPAYFHLDKLNSGYLSSELKFLRSFYTRILLHSISHKVELIKNVGCSVPKNK